ncbi:hypothetical protein MMK73_003036 [Providencia rettgeri]|nr:hypothetical protein [Providencia rettgeri]
MAKIVNIQEQRILKDYLDSINSPDPRLYDLALMVNGGYSHPITVSAGGIIYSGTLVGEKEWIESNLKLVKETSDLPFNDENIQYYNELIDNFDDSNEHFPRFVHMKDVNIISHPSADMPAFLWRIRIDRIDAFHIGRK